MENISGKSRASFPWTFSCATMGLAVSVSLCFAQGDRNALQELQRRHDEGSSATHCRGRPYRWDSDRWQSARKRSIPTIPMSRR
jgi:hypothetical protein